MGFCEPRTACLVQIIEEYLTMDAYQKILVHIYDMTGGKETVDVDLIDLLKREGYFPSLDEIREQLKSESWVTESRPNVVRITHWGVAAARKVGSARPDAVRMLEKEAKYMVSESRDLAVVIEEFIADTSADRFRLIENKLAQIKQRLEAIRGAM